MKKLYAFLLILIGSLASGQVIFSENFGVPTSNTLLTSYTGFQNGSPIVFSGTGDVRTSTPSSGYTGASGGGNVFLTSSSAPRTLIISGINTSAYQQSEIQLTFGYLTNSTGTQLVLEQSTDDGTNWTPITFTQNPNTSWNLVTIAPGQIPSATNLTLRFSQPAAAQMRVDDVILTNISASCPLSLGTVSAACDASTLALDNYTVTIPFTGGGSGNYSITGGTVGGDNPNTVAEGNIVITGLTEGTNYSISITGNTCNFTVSGNAPSCKPINTLPYYESFNYTAGSSLTDQQKWSPINSGDAILSSSPSLTYTEFASEGNKVDFDGAGIDALTPITEITANTLYYSMLLNITNVVAATDAAGGYFAAFTSNSTTYGATLWAKKVDDNTYNLGIEVRTAAGATTTYTTTAYNVGTTYFIVVSYTFGPDASDDTVKLWVNPAITSTESTPTITDTHTGTDLTAISGFLLRQDSTTETPFISIDELRIGTSWTDVVPQSAGLVENSIPGLKVYPNPAKNGQIVFVNSDSSVEKNVAIYNVLGRKVLETTTQQNTINTDGLTTGVYMVKITEEGKTATRKLVIQ